MKVNKIQTGLRLNESTYKKAKALALQEQRSINNLFEYVIQKYIRDYEDKNGPIQIPSSSD